MDRLWVVPSSHRHSELGLINITDAAAYEAVRLTGSTSTASYGNAIRLKAGNTLMSRTAFLTVHWGRNELNYPAANTAPCYPCITTIGIRVSGIARRALWRHIKTAITMCYTKCCIGSTETVRLGNVRDSIFVVRHRPPTADADGRQRALSRTDFSNNTGLE